MFCGDCCSDTLSLTSIFPKKAEPSGAPKNCFSMSFLVCCLFWELCYTLMTKVLLTKYATHRQQNLHEAVQDWASEAYNSAEDSRLPFLLSLSPLELKEKVYTGIDSILFCYQNPRLISSQTSICNSGFLEISYPGYEAHFCRVSSSSLSHKSANAASRSSSWWTRFSTQSSKSSFKEAYTKVC